MGPPLLADAALELQPSPRFVKFALAVVLAGAISFILVVRLTAPDQVGRYIGPSLAVLLVLLCWALLGRGQVRLALQCFGVCFWVMAAIASYFLGGVRTPVVVAFPVIVMVMGWAFNTRIAMLSGGLTVLLLGGLWWAGWGGLLPERPDTNHAMYAVMQILLTVLAMFLVHFLIHAYESRLRQLKALSDELTASRNLLQTIIDTAPVRVFWKDQNLRYLGCNPAFARDAGLAQPSELIGKFDNELSWRDHAQAYTDDDRRVMQSGVPQHSYDEPQTTPTGQTIWLRTSKVPLRDAAQRTIGVLGVYEDITLRKQAESALQASESRARDLAHMLRMLCDNVPDLIWAKDLNNRYMFANKAMCEQLLCANDTEEPVGKDDMFFAMRERARHPEDSQWHTFGEMCRDSDPITLQNGRASQFDEYGTVRGKFLFLDVRKAPFVNDQGEVLGVVGSGRNVTAQKAIEERLELASLVLQQSSEA